MNCLMDLKNIMGVGEEVSYYIVAIDYTVKKYASLGKEFSLV